MVRRRKGAPSCAAAGGDKLNGREALGFVMLSFQYEVGPGRNFAYLIGDPRAGKGAVIDPADSFPMLEAEAVKHGLAIEYVFNTHSHPDHTAGNHYFHQRGAKVVAHETAPGHHDRPVKDGEVVQVGDVAVKVLHTPGHRFDSVCLIAGPNLYSGDTLFIGECGRTDLMGSNPKQMHHTLLVLLRDLPDDLVVMPGHNYGPVPSRTLGEEKRLNYTLQPRTLEEFLAFMAAP